VVTALSTSACTPFFSLVLPSSSSAIGAPSLSVIFPACLVPCATLLVLVTPRISYPVSCNLLVSRAFRMALVFFMQCLLNTI
jgi:hypothetical protein